MGLISVSSVDAGRSCPYCRFPLKDGVTAVQCDSCAAIHHEDCWSEGGGCSQFGCSNSAAMQQQAQQLPPIGKQAALDPRSADVVLKGAPAVAPGPGLAETNENKNSTVLLIALGVLAASVLIVGALALFNLASDDSSSTPAADATVEPAAAADDASPNESDSMAARRVVRVLRAYTGAYSSEDRAQLAEIMTANVERWGVNGPTQCAHDVGRHAVLEAYQSQFDVNPSLSYELQPLSGAEVERLSETRARVLTNYVISGGTPAPISFSLERSDSAGWRISRVKVGACV